MASLCKRQQCTIERRGFRQELDSWRHKLIHCVGFESILEGLFDPGLVEDLKLFKGREPEAVSDWSFDENCLFCCLRRDKVKEHLVSLSNQGLEDTPKPLLVKDQTKINRLEKQAEEFLNAVLYRKDVPSFSDPHIPIVAREIMQRMIRQFAAEYTSKTNSTQDSLSDPQPSTDQSLARPPSFLGAPPPPATSPAAPLAASAAHSQNPVLSKLLMADQDSPLDLTVKKPPAEPSEQDGVLDLSLKKNRHSSRLSVHSPYQSAPASTIKGEPPEVHGAKAKELQSTSTLEQFMAKLCPHHQRQIVDALGFLQTASNPTSGSQGAVCSAALPNLETPEKPCSQSRHPITSTPKGMLDVRETPRTTSGAAAVKGVIDTAISLKTSIIAGPALDLRTPGLCSTTGLSIPSLDAESSHHSDHAPPLKVIIKSDGKKLCVLPPSLTHSGTLEEKQGNSDLSNRAEAHSARLSSAVKRHGQSGQLQQARQRGSIGPTKDSQAKVSVHKAFSTIPPLYSKGTARKTMRSSIDYRPRESVRKVITDPDLGHYDIVYIDKPITECLREQRRPFTPRRNARKSTRGPMYVEEMWELKTVRTLANRTDRSSCPKPTPELVASVTPKQILAKPDGVPPVDMPLAGGCGEAVNQHMPSEQPEERATPGMGDVVEAADGEPEVLVETSQTDQSQVVKEPSNPPSPLSSPTENSETHVDADVNGMQEAGSDSEQVRESGSNEESSASETAATALLEADEESNEPDEVSNETTEEVAETETTREQSESEQVNEAGPPLVSDEVPSSESAVQQDCETLAPAETVAVVAEDGDKNEDGKDDGKDVEQPLEPQPEVQKVTDNLDGEQNHSPTAPAEAELVEVQEDDTVQPQENDTVQPQENDTVQLQENDTVQPQDNDTVQPVKVDTVQPVKVDTVQPVKNDTVQPVKNDTVQPVKIDTLRPVKIEVIEVVPETEENDEDEVYDVSSKTLDELLKELPPWRRKRGVVVSLPKRLREAKLELMGYVNCKPIMSSDRSLRPRSATSTRSPLKRRGKKHKNTPVDAPAPNSPKPKERDASVKSENTLVIPQVEESSPETTQSITRSSFKLRRSEARTKQNAKHAAQSTRNTESLPDPPIDSPQTPESRRPLRSARLKQAETAKSPQSVNTSSVSARPTMSHSLPSGEDVPSVPISSSPIPVSSTPPILPSSAVSESSNGSAVPESTVEQSVAKPKSAETDLCDEQNSAVERSLPTKQKLRSSKAEKVSEDENPQVSSQVSSPMKSQNSEQNETPEPSTPFRSKRLLRKETEGSEGVKRKAVPPSLDEKTVGGDSTNSSAPDKLVKMPLRSEIVKAGLSSQPLPQSTPVENKKLALRSQRLATPSTSDPRLAEKLRDVMSPIRIKPEKITKMAVRSSPFCETSALSPSRVTSVITPRHESLKQTTAQKFLGALNGEENQHLQTNLNMKFDKMQKGWIQMDKEGLPVKKHRNMSDRQAAIWKSKSRRTRKPKSQDHQKHSPVQMLFMKNFTLTSICRWFLESTETKSLVIVKKVNTRLPSETQLCFHSNSGASGTSQGVYPSLQAERLKKHLKKFAIASPVKSNPKSQKLIAKALEQEANVGRERREVFTGTRLTKPFSSSAEAQKQSEAQKTSGKPKNPASARILRKYSNIRLHGQQTSVKRKEAPTKRATSMKASKSGSKTNLKSTVKGQKSRLPVNKQMKESKIRKGKISSGRKATAKSPVQERTVRSPGSNRASRDLTRKDTDLPLRSSPRPGTPKRLKNKLESGKKQLEAEKTGVEKSTPTKASSTRTQTKESLQGPITESRVSGAEKGAEITVETLQQNTDVKPPISPDQVLTRSQRKMEATVSLTESPSSASKKVSTVAIMQGGSPRSAAKKAQEPTPTGTGTPKSVSRKGLASTPPRSGTPKSSTKRAQEPLQSPAKRTRMSHSK